MSGAPATAPAVSVLMVVQDSEAYVGDAVASILEQTFEDFEFAIYDDGSRDGSTGIVEAFAARDARVVLRRRQRAGLATWLREGVDAARAEFVARMDADDVAHPERLTRQLAYLRAQGAPIVVKAASLLCRSADRYVA